MRLSLKSILFFCVIFGSFDVFSLNSSDHTVSTISREIRDFDVQNHDAEFLDEFIFPHKIENKRSSVEFLVNVTNLFYQRQARNKQQLFSRDDCIDAFILFMAEEHEEEFGANNSVLDIIRHKDFMKNLDRHLVKNLLIEMHDMNTLKAEDR